METYIFEEKTRTEALDLVMTARENGIVAFLVPEELNQEMEFLAEEESQLQKDSRVIVTADKKTSGKWIRLNDLPGAEKYGVALSNMAMYLRAGTPYT